MKLIQILTIVAAFAIAGCGHTQSEQIGRSVPGQNVTIDDQVRLLQLNPFVPNKTKERAVNMLRAAGPQADAR